MALAGGGDRVGDVSVVIATYKRPHLIERALDSVARQTVRPAEILVVDDCSRDHTEDVVRAWSERMAIPIRFVRMERNGGAGAARNRAMALAGQAYVAFLDSDDEYLPNALEVLLEPLSLYPDAVVSFADARIVSDGRLLPDMLMSRALPSEACAPTDHVEIRRLKDPVETLLLTSMIPTCAAAFRRDAAVAVGLMPEYRFGEDWLFWLRLSSRGDFLCRFAPVARVHRQDDNLTGDASVAEASAQVLRGLLALLSGQAGVPLEERHKALLQAAIGDQTRIWRYQRSRLGLSRYIRALRGEVGRMTGGAFAHLRSDPKSLLRAVLSGGRRSR